jgi:hypothetical protein
VRFLRCRLHRAEEAIVYMLDWLGVRRGICMILGVTVMTVITESKAMELGVESHVQRKQGNGSCFR